MRYSKRMRTLIALIVAFICATPLSVWAQCPLEPGSVVTTIEREPVNITYHNDLDRREIGQMQGNADLGSYQQIGLTKAEPGYRLTVEGTIAPAGGPWFCAVLTKAKVIVRVSKLDVYVTSEYRKNSCLYNAVLEHELKHVANLRDTLNDMIGRMKGELARAATLAGVGDARSREGALVVLKDRIQAKLKPLFDDWQREHNKRDKALDSAESFIAEESLCP